MAQEYIRLGQRVKSFTVEAQVGDEWKEIARATTIGYKRILRFPTVEATKIRFNITGSKACPVISKIGIYNAPQILTPPVIIRNQAGDVIITPADPESEVYYTVDGSEPASGSNKYSGPIQSNSKLEVKAIAFEPSSEKSSSVRIERFDLPRKDWKILGIEDEKAYAILDGNSFTAWHQKTKDLPVDLVVDLGKELNIVGFTYHPDMGLWGPGIITEYQFFVSADNKRWKLVSAGEFSNIKNNPLWQTKMFEEEQARYIMFRALKNTENNKNIGYAEIGLLTN
jgi:alpha-L-fucosidase